MKKGFLILSVLGCFLLSFYSVAGVCAEEKQETVKVYFYPNLNCSPLLIAQEEGFFKEEGLSVEFVKQDDVAEAFLLFLQGSLDVVWGPPTPGMFVAAEKEEEFRFVTCLTFLTKDDVSTGIVFKKDPAYADSPLQHLRHKKIGWPVRYSLNHFLFEKLLIKENIPVEDIEITTMAFPLIAASLQRGILEAGYLNEPFITKLKEETEQESYIPLGRVFPDTPQLFIVFGKALLKKNPQAAVKFMVAYLRGFRQYQEGKTERNIEILSKFLKLDKEVLKKVAWPSSSPNGIYKAEPVLEDYQAWLIAKKVLQKRADVHNMIDTSFLKKAEKILKDRKK
jgi:NitT/TauT family transport system substrate-binding protein